LKWFQENAAHSSSQQQITICIEKKGKEEVLKGLMLNPDKMLWMDQKSVTHVRKLTNRTD